MSWLNLNESLNNLKGHITNFATNVLELEEDGAGSGVSSGEKEIYPGQVNANVGAVAGAVHAAGSIQTNQDQNARNVTTDANNWSWDVAGSEAKTDEIKTNETITHLRRMVSDLERDKAEYLANLEQLDREYQENTVKLASIRDKLEIEHGDLKKEYDALRADFEKKLNNAEQKYSYEMKQNEKYRSKIEELESRIGKSEEIERKYREEVEINESLLLRINELEGGKKEEKQIDDLKIENEKLTIRLREVEAENAKLSRSEEELLLRNEELSAIIENERLENNEGDQREEILENNYLIKELEGKISDLVLNNDLLVAEIEQMKNKPVLETVSETNEDNMLQLEMQLESTKQTIDRLQTELSESKNHAPIDESLQEMQNENESLKLKLDQLEKIYESCRLEKESCESDYYKLKTDFENTEYQLTESNVNNDAIREENDLLRQRFESLSDAFEAMKGEFDSAKSVNKMLYPEVKKMQTELVLREEENKSLENSIEDLKRQMQDYKLSEETLRLQSNKLGNELMLEAQMRRGLEKECQEMRDLVEDISTFLDSRGIVIDFKSQPFDMRDLLEKIKKSLGDLLDEKARLSSTLTKLDEILKENETVKSLLGRIVDIVKKTDFDKQFDSTPGSDYKTIESAIEHLSNQSARTIDQHQLISKIETLQAQNDSLRDSQTKISQALLEEQSISEKLRSEKSIQADKENLLTKKLERLQSHLIEIEEHYTQELLLAEGKKSELETRLHELELRERNSSNLYTSVNIRVNQQVEALQNQVKMITANRDELRRKLGEAEAVNKEHVEALANLQNVLLQFQKNKDGEIMQEATRIGRQVEQERLIQEQLRGEIATLKKQLEESKLGLSAAARLSDQLEICHRQNKSLKKEVSELQEHLLQAQEKLKQSSKKSEDKIEKSLIKNLVIGLLSCNSNLTKDQAQIVKIISHVLDFNQQDHEKLNLDTGASQSWFGLLQSPGRDRNSQESLTQAFVKFLQSESTPRAIPEFVSESVAEATAPEGGGARRTSGAGPRVLNEILLPTFSDFGENRNSSSILKDVLKENH